MPGWEVLEVGDARRKQVRGDGRSPADAYGAALETELSGDVLTEPVVAGDDAPRLVDCLAAEVGELDTVPAADQQLGAEICFDLLKAAGQG
jgi:hypothetical protein